MPQAAKASLLLAVLCVFPLNLQAQAPQPFEAASLLSPAKDSWPTYHGNYSGQRHSDLVQITTDNVHTLEIGRASCRERV